VSESVKEIQLLYIIFNFVRFNKNDDKLLTITIDITRVSVVVFVLLNVF